jgi:hypothetical protein
VNLTILVLVSVAAAPSPTFSVARIGWLAGSWFGDENGMRMEEHWTTPAGGLMVAMHRDVRPGRPAWFEFLRIEEDSTGVRYMAMPGGRSATPFPLVKQTDSSVTFENPSHDYPQRIMYTLEPDGRLHARVEGRVKGTLRSEEWRWRREAR